MLLVVLLLCVFDHGATEDRTVTVNDTSVQIVGRSGKMIYWHDSGGVAGDSDKIFIEMDSLQEKDINGDPVGTTGAVKHSFNTFASQSFTFSELTTTLVPESDSASSSYLTFDCQLDGLSSSLKVYIYLLTTSGTVNLDGEQRQLFGGMLKFSMELKDWEFCTPDTCTQGGNGQTGEIIDFTITIKATGDGSITSEGDNEYDLGMGSRVYLSQKLLLDNSTWLNMTEGYPLYQQQGSKHKFTFRFPKFNTSIFYDPSLEPPDEGTPGQEPGGDTSGQEPVTPSSPNRATISFTTDVVGSIEGKDTSKVHDVKLDVAGRSGMVAFWRAKDGSQVVKEDDKITIEMNSVQEKNISGDAVGTSGPISHSFSSFATQDFTFSELATTTVPDSDGVTSKYLTYNCTLGNLNSTLKVYIYLLTSDGTVTLDDETRQVQEGMLKMSIELQNWDFCTPASCTDNGGESGEFVDFTLTFKPVANSPLAIYGSDRYGLGAGSTLTFSRKVKVDGVWQTLSSEFPKYVQDGSLHNFIFRIPKFTSSAFYDPDISAPAIPTSKQSTWSRYAVVILVVMGGVITLFSMYLICYWNRRALSTYRCCPDIQ